MHTLLCRGPTVHVRYTYVYRTGRGRNYRLPKNIFLHRKTVLGFRCFMALHCIRNVLAEILWAGPVVATYFLLAYILILRSVLQQ